MEEEIAHSQERDYGYAYYCELFLTKQDCTVAEMAKIKTYSGPCGCDTLKMVFHAARGWQFGWFWPKLIVGCRLAE